MLVLWKITGACFPHSFYLCNVPFSLCIILKLVLKEKCGILSNTLFKMTVTVLLNLYEEHMMLQKPGAHIFLWSLAARCVTGELWWHDTGCSSSLPSTFTWQCKYSHQCYHTDYLYQTTNNTKANLVVKDRTPTPLKNKLKKIKRKIKVVWRTGRCMLYVCLNQPSSVLVWGDAMLS